MDVGLRTVLVKGPIVPKHVIAIFESDWKHLLNDRACHSRKITKGDIPLEQMPKLFAEIYDTTFTARFTAYIRLLCQFENLFVSNLQTSFMLISEQWFLYA